MEGPSSEARVDGASGSETQQAARVPQPKKKKPEDFKFGKILGEGSFSTVRAHTLESFLWAACKKLLWERGEFVMFLFFFSSQGCPGERAGNEQRICK